MVQSLQLGTAARSGDQKDMRRLNRLPIIAAIVLVVLFLGVVVIGLSWRGLPFGRGNGIDGASNASASSFGDKLKQGVSDGIIGEPDQREVFQPTPVIQPQKNGKEPPVETPRQAEREDRRPRLESEEEWLARLQREQDEQYIRERQRQRMARLQARAGALDSPLKVDISDLQRAAPNAADASRQSQSQNRVAGLGGASDLYAAAMRSGLLGQNADPNGQTSKEDFFNQDIKDLGYLPNQVVPQFSPYELKRGSVIPATLITGLNSDLPGRITAQVSQNVYDSATGYRLLIPQGARLFGRYDSKVSFGQERVLVVWTDLIFPNGATLQIGGMAGIAEATPVLAFRGDDAGAFDEVHVRLLRALMPHVQRALELRLRLAQDEHAASLTHAAVNALTVGVAVVDASLRIRFVNDMARQYLAGPEAGLALKRPGPFAGSGIYLAAMSRDDAASLRRLVSSATSGGAGGSMRLNSRAGSVLAVMVTPAPLQLSNDVYDMNVGHAREALALLILRPLDRKVSPQAAILCEMFDLSRAEAEVAVALSGGASAEDVARGRGVSLMTIRSQIRSILGKSEAENLRDFERTMAMVASLAPQSP